MMFFLVVASVLLFSASIKAQSAECSEGLQRCTNTYMADVMEHAQSQNIGMICQDLNIFIKCIFDLECGMQEEQKNMVIEKVRSEIAAQGFDCDVNLEGVSTRKPRTTIAPEYTTQPKTCLAATQVCTQNYINEAFEMARQRGEDLSWFCPMVNKFVACLMNSPCRLEEVQDAVEDKIEAELRQKGIDCEINYESNTDTDSATEKAEINYGRDSATKQAGTSLILTMAAAVCASFKFFF